MTADGTGNVPPFDHVHTHAVACYWDYREARWCCGPAATGELATPGPAMTEIASGESSTAPRPESAQAPAIVP